MIATVSRLIHRGGTVDLRGAGSFRLIFNISGGQRVEQRHGSEVVACTVEAGSIRLLAPGGPEFITIAGEADTLQVFMAEGFVHACRGEPTSGPPLQASAIQALVALHRKGSANEDELRPILERMAWAFTEQRAAPAGSAHGGLSPAARRRVCALIDARVSGSSRGSLLLGDLAEAAGLSVHHFIKAFRRTEGETPHARVLERRVDYAVSLLLRADARVDFASAAAGFSSPSHFIGEFRKRVGVTPGAFRDAVRFPAAARRRPKR